MKLLTHLGLLLKLVLNLQYILPAKFYRLKRNSIIFLLIICGNVSFSQHVQYTEKKKPVVENKSQNTDAIVKPPNKADVEEQYMCNFLSRPDVAPQLPIVINNVSPEMVKNLKEKYEGRLYSITTLNMTDDRLKYKLKICDKDNGKFRSEYLDIDGNVINNPNLEY